MRRRLPWRSLALPVNGVPSSAASFSSSGRVVVLLVMKNVPAGYVVPFTVERLPQTPHFLARVRAAGSPRGTSRSSACRGSSRAGSSRPITSPAAACTSSFSSSNGPSNPSTSAVELHAHLVGERPAGHVVGRRRRRGAGREVVRVVLRLEHVEDVARNACADFTTYDPAGYFLPPTANADFARCTVTPVPMSVLTNFVAVRKSGWSAGRI